MCADTRTEDIVDATLQVVRWLPVEMLDETPHSGQLAGMTPLHIVCGGRDTAGRRHEVIEALCKAGANKEAVDYHSRTPLLVCGGVAYRDGADTMYRQGASMTACLSNGFNFGDFSKPCNAALKKWWCDITKLEPTNKTKPVSSSNIYHRSGCSDKRHDRKVVRDTQHPQDSPRSFQRICTVDLFSRHPGIVNQTLLMS